MVGSHVTQSVSCINADYAYVHIHVTAGIPMSGRRFTKPSFGLFQTSPLLLMKLLQQLLMKRPTGHPILVVNQRIAKFDVCYGISFIVIVSSSYCYDYTIRLLATAFFILVYWNHSVARCQTLHHYHLLVQGFYPFARSCAIKGN